MRTLNTREIIIGGGLTGLSLGIRDLRKGNEVTIIEKGCKVGGLAQSIRFNNFLFDLGPHIFRSKDQNIISHVQGLGNNESFEGTP